jgi:hypothetical protein
VYNEYLYMHTLHIFVIPAKAGIQEKTVNDPPEDAIDELALMPLAGKEQGEGLKGKASGIKEREIFREA